MANKTTAITHLAVVPPDQLAGALNNKFLGARILQSGGADGKAALREWSLRAILDEFSNANSRAYVSVLILQAVAFALGLLLHILLPSSSASTGFFWLAVLLGHQLPRRAIMSACAFRFSIHLLMFIVLVGAICIGKLREAATVSFVISASEWLIGRVNKSVEEAMGKNLIGTATHATKLEAGNEKRMVPISELKPGDVVLVKTGEVIPVDGKMLQASMLKVDEASVTGEALPAEKKIGSSVSSGTVVVSGVGELECTAKAEDSFQGRMIRAVDDARNSQSKTDELVNKIAAVYTPVVIVISALVAIFSEDCGRGLATLISACPCALVAAAPVAQACTLTRLLTRLQVLVKNARALENLGKMTALAVDKTGTITEGNFSLVDSRILEGAGDLSQEELYRLLAAIEVNDPHPLAACLVQQHVGCVASHVAGKGSSALPKVTKFTRVQSAGVWGKVEGHIVGAGSLNFLDSMSIDLPDEAEALVKEWESSGNSFTVVYMIFDDEVAMVLRLQDNVRPDAREAVDRLRDLGVEAALLTGDLEGPAQCVAKSVGIEAYSAAMKPHDKESWIRARQCATSARVHRRPSAAHLMDVSPEKIEEGMGQPLLKEGRTCDRREIVGMLGDGLNDSPALAAADVGIAVSAGLQLTMDAADIVVNQGTSMLARLSEAVYFAKACNNLVLQNILMAAIIKGAAIVLGATGNLSLGSGVLSDTGAFLVVLINSLRPLRWNVGENESFE